MKFTLMIKKTIFGTFKSYSNSRNIQFPKDEISSIFVTLKIDSDGQTAVKSDAFEVG
jgi:hypothetical protein